MVGAKYHLCKDHLIEQLDYWGAIGPYNEEFGDSNHVDGNKEMRKFGNMRSAAQREAAISRHHEIKENTKINLIKKAV